MKEKINKGILFIAILFYTISNINGQCSITLNTQEEVDNFTVIDPDDPLCSSGFVWSLSINGSDITNLEALSVIDSCGRLTITNTSLVDLSGLDNLIKVYRNSQFSGSPTIAISNNPLLENLEGLENLRTISNFTLSDNPNLKNTDALNITTFESYESGFGWYYGPDISVINNGMLTSFTGLPGLTGASNVTIKDNSKLTDISALSNLKSCFYREGLGNIAGSMVIENNDALTSLSILDTLNVTRDFSIIDNDSLQNLSGVSLQTRDLILDNNKSLKEFGDFNLALKQDWLFGPSMRVINNDSLISIGVVEFEEIPQNLDFNLSIEGNKSLSICSEDYICSIIETHDQNKFDLNVSNNDMGCNSNVELCFDASDNLDFSVTVIGDFYDCRHVYYDIIINNTEPNAHMSSLTFQSMEIGNSQMFNYVETENATISGDTLIWNDIFLNFFESDTFSIEIELLGDFDDISELSFFAELSEDDNDSNNSEVFEIGYRTVEDLVLQTQAEVDSCICISKVENDLIIKESTTITNFDSLSNLLEVGDKLIIENLDSLRSLSGFDTLSIVEDIEINDNDLLESITAFNALMICEDITIHDNVKLDSFNGLNNLIDARALVISDNPNLLNISDFDSLNWLNYLAISNSPKLEHLPKLGIVSFLWSGILLEDNSSLLSLHGLESVETFPSGDLIIRNCDRLKDFSGLNNELELDGIEISQNDSLLNFNGLNPEELRANLIITFNKSLESLDGFSPAEIYRDFILENNASFNSFGDFNPIDILTAGTGDSYSIRNNPQLDLCNIDFICTRIGSGQNISIWNNGTECNSVAEVASTCTIASGRVFFDKNENGIQDTDENGAENFKVNVLPSEEAIYTNENGEFRIFTNETFTQEVGLELNPYWTLSSDSISYTLPQFFLNDYPFDFGIIPGEELRSASMNMTFDPTRCNTIINAKIRYTNDGNVTEDLKLELQLDPNVELINSSLNPDEEDGSNISWDVSNGPFETTDITLELMMPDEQFTGETLDFLLKLYGVDDELDILTESVVTPIVLCSYDPNDKLVMPIGMYDENYTLFDEKLTYTVRFQNTGNAEALDIEIRDTLDNNLDISTFKVVNSSFPVFTNLRDRAISFYFEGINLPDSTSNEMASHGFVTYEIYPNGGLDENTRIKNTASIYFDFNPPIVTNTVNNTFVSMFPTATEETYRQDHVIFPNPSSGLLFVENTEEINLVTLRSSDGQSIKTYSRFPIDFTKYPIGLYYIELNTSEGVTYQKVIKQ